MRFEKSGWLYKPSDCLGDKLLETMCKLTKPEHFESHQTAGTRTDFGLYALRKLVSSWPNLRTVCIFALSSYYGAVTDGKNGTDLPGRRY